MYGIFDNISKSHIKAVKDNYFDENYKLFQIF